jgi:hypothetical protein
MLMSDLQIKNAKPKEKRYRLYDERSMCLEAGPSGGKWWRFKYDLGEGATGLTAPELLYAIQRAIQRLEKRGAPERTPHIGQPRAVSRFAIATGRCSGDITRDLLGSMTPVVEQHFAAATTPEFRYTGEEPRVSATGKSPIKPGYEVLTEEKSTWFVSLLLL